MTRGDRRSPYVRPMPRWRATLVGESAAHFEQRREVPPEDRRVTGSSPVGGAKTPGQAPSEGMTVEIAVPGHGHLGVAQLVGDLPGRELRLVQDRGAGLVEHMAGVA